ncbi:NAD(P)H-dependent oxidoreductase [Eupransor demetentiae]|uniref:NADPH-quinone reductase (Modulator of drug activity B) (MdaB) n=1 Tax=Eupransor demetentiae TaxID=3109584 RepID=A0ABM9N5K8_9LACO|nr:Putative NADPH-quinone reductase (modulator of drug activity B) (MdaB) [Lactobacillaceae bacterium LMG 33000]
MKILVIQGSPDAGSFNHANALNYVEKAKQAGHEVELVDLAEADFDPVLRYGYRKHMEDESFPDSVQQKMIWADHWTIFFPVWWASEPSVLHGLLERTLTPHVAYQYKKVTDMLPAKLFKGKTADLLITSRGPAFYTRYFAGVVGRWRNGILGYCGVKLKQVKIMGMMHKPKDTDARRKAFIETCAATLNNK